MNNLETNLPGLLLLEPDSERDAPYAVKWLEGEAGKTTLKLMGNPESGINSTTLEAEKARLKDFNKLGREGKQMTWMMQLNGVTIGAVWVVITDTDHLPAPALSVMIGDPAARGQGIGTHAVQALIAYMRTATDYSSIYARHLVSNQASAHLLHSVGFTDFGPAYQDDDGLEFQNVSFVFSNTTQS